MSNTHERIINAARDLFSTKGYAATTTKDIASHAGISEVTLFRHFESKRNLFHEALHKSTEADMLIDFFSNQIHYDLEMDLKTLSSLLLTLYEENGPLIRMLIKDKEQNGVSEISQPHKERVLKDSVRAYFVKMHEMGKIADDPIMCSKFYFHNAMGFLMRKYVLERCDDGVEYYNWMIEKTINAIKV